MKKKEINKMDKKEDDFDTEYYESFEWFWDKDISKDVYNTKEKKGEEMKEDTSRLMIVKRRLLKINLELINVEFKKQALESEMRELKEEQEMIAEITGGD